jgi:hypothetical protein
MSFLNNIKLNNVQRQVNELEQQVAALQIGGAPVVAGNIDMNGHSLTELNTIFFGNTGMSITSTPNAINLNGANVNVSSLSIANMSISGSTGTLVINNNDNDLLGNHRLTDSFINPTGVNDVIDPNSPNYSLLYFQNSYLTKYSFSVNVGEVPSVEQTYIADNINFYISGSGVNYTTLNIQSGNQNIENTK